MKRIELAEKFLAKMNVAQKDMDTNGGSLYHVGYINGLKEAVEALGYIVININGNWNVNAR